MKHFFSLMALCVALCVACTKTETDPECVAMRGLVNRVVSEKVSLSACVPERFFLNYCTFGYTMPWWNWEQWEHFIDWMALNGINLPLAITDQEAVLYEVWSEMGLTDEEIRSYFTGPAHLPWHRMQNIDRWGGPLPMSWLENQKELQKK